LAEALYRRAEKERDVAKRERLLREAGSRGHVSSLLLLVKMIVGGEMDADAEVVEMLRRSDHCCAKRKLAWMLVGGRGCEPDVAGAIRLYEEAVDDGCELAMVTFGQIKAEGELGLEADDEGALALFRRAARLGNAEALNWSARLFFEGRGVPEEDPREAVRLWKLAAEKDDKAERVEANFHLSLRYADGEGVVAPDDAESFRRCRRAVDESDDDGRAMVQMAKLYEFGVGVERDVDEAKTWLQRAVALDDESSSAAAAEYRLDALNCLLATTSADAVYEKADASCCDTMRIGCLLEAASRGHAAATLDAGDAFFNGRGVPKNAARAVSYWQQAADKGYCAAKRALAGVLRNGTRGVARDQKKALALFHEAHELGCPIAAYDLGEIYEKGLCGATPCRKWALHCFRAAAAKGVNGARQAADRIAAAEVNGKRAPPLRSGNEEEDPLPLRKEKECAHCGLVSTDLKLCKQCRSARYCSRECQVAAWPAHQLACRPRRRHRPRRDTSETIK